MSIAMVARFAMDRLSHASRSLRRSPTLALSAGVVLVMGIGANGAVFAVLSNLLLQPPPGVRDARSLWRLRQEFIVPMTGQRQVRTVFSYPELTALRDAMARGTTIAGYATRVDVARLAGLAPQAVISTYIDGAYFPLLGVRPILGRFFTSGEAAGSGPTSAAVISDRLWRECCNRSRSVIGRPLEVGGRQYTIIGVAPSPFLGVGLDASDVWLTFGTVGSAAVDDDPLHNAHDLRLRVLIRTRSADAPKIAAGRATEVLRRLDVVGDTHAAASVLPVAMKVESRSGLTAVANARVLFVATSVIFLLACGNVAGLLIVRTAQRRPEFAVRYALGASRWMLATDAGAEGVLLAGGAGGGGLVAAIVGGAALRNALIPGVMWAPATLDPRLALIVGSAALICALVTALIPVAYMSRLDLAGPRAAPNWASRLRITMVAGQSALSLVLLAFAGLFVRSLRNVERIDIGYHGVHQIWFAADPKGVSSALPSGAGVVALNTLRSRIGALPGVEAVALTSTTPFASIMRARLFTAEGDSIASGPGIEQPAVQSVTPAFRQAAGMRLLAGRDFTLEDRAGAMPVAVVSALFARRGWPGLPALGQCVIVGDPHGPCRRVVGVVEDAHVFGLIEARRPAVYLPMTQIGGPLGAPRAIVLRLRSSAGESTALAVRRLIASAGGPVSEWELRNLASVLSPQIQPWRLTALLFTSLGALAMLVAAAGTFGAVAYAAAQRTKELGIRRALGAGSIHVIGVVVRGGVAAVGAGCILGIALTFVLSRVAGATLYGVEPYDPRSVGAAVAIVMLMGLGASLLPAVKAARVHPMVALRSD